MSIHYITLVRHGQYDIDFGDVAGLNDTGRMQALMVADALRGKHFDRVLVSPLNRARETARLIIDALDDSVIRLDSRLEEGVPSIPRRWSEWFAKHRPQVTPERVAQCAAHLQGFFEEIFVSMPVTMSDYHTLIIAHGNVIRYLLSLSIDGGDNAWSNIMIFHCSMSQVMVESGGYPMLTSVNDLAHIPPEFHSER